MQAPKRARAFTNARTRTLVTKRNSSVYRHNDSAGRGWSTHLEGVVGVTDRNLNERLKGDFRGWNVDRGVFDATRVSAGVYIVRESPERSCR